MTFAIIYVNINDEILYKTEVTFLLTDAAIAVINDILKKGGSIEIRKRKGEIVIIETKGKVKYTIITDE